MRHKIAIFCGGPSSEHEVSLKSAQTIYNHINKEKYEPYFFYISKKNNGKLCIGSYNFNFSKITSSTPLIKALQDLKEKNFFALLAGVHGEFVEDGKLQSLLELLQIPYSGSNVPGSAISMDKYRTALIVQKIPGLIVPKSFIHKTDLPLKRISLNFPVVVKPNNLGSSVGVSFAESLQEVQDALIDLQNTYGIEEALIQEKVENGIEASCGCLQKKNGECIPLPPIEIVPQNSQFFDYSAKYDTGGSLELTPPQNISPNISNNISDIAIKVHELLGLKGYSRSDFIIKGNSIYFLETNTLPGMTETSLLPQEAKAAGISFMELIDFVITN